MAKIYDVRELKAMAKYFTFEGSTFYASDLGLSSGDIQRLKAWWLIVPTGKTKEVFVEVGDNLYKKVPAKEWRKTDNMPSMKEWFQNSVNALHDLSDSLKALGF
jgi:hypothetical protein